MFDCSLRNLGIAALFSAALLSCALDDRALAPKAGVAGAAGTAGSNEPANTAGSGGSAGLGVPLAPLPVDCDFSGSSPTECATAIENPGFNSGTTPWSAEPGPVTLSWYEEDALEEASSGSLSVVNALTGEASGPASVGAVQCLETSAGQIYGLAADVFIPNGQGDGLDGGPYLASAGLSMIFKDGPGCTGFTVGNATSDLVDAAGGWAHVEGKAIAPQGATSVAVRLVTFKSFRQFRFEARFDNVLVKAY